ncbi:MAG TPA: anthranilate phosphoribosyltransferase [Candidatus Paceibacterota bacterium]|nr:anthranilate phosphoribosyltransferase [Verrucomicrobiota bacterium]HSA11413.1 anthranilate phosphoribosyltransferase [Candidatus Paceibacterota bacterium]
MLESLTRRLALAHNLTEDEVRQAVGDLVDEAVPATTKAEFLTQLARKGETVDEIATFARELGRRSVRPALVEELRSGVLLDVVGTGGDHLSTFNISTTVSLIAAAAGVRVVKHGNRASTSLVGSADVMEALGIPFDWEPEQAVRSLCEHGFAFFFAPKYHPAFRHIIPARKLCAAQSQSTIFNFLGPLLNPAAPTAALIGVPRPDLCAPLARVLQSLGMRRAMVVCGAVPGEAGTVRYLDELSPLGPTTVAEFYQERALACSTVRTEWFPLQPAVLADLRGGDREVNASIIRRVLKGEERGPKRDAVLLNAAAALFVADRVRSLAEGWELAGQTIDSGRAAAKLAELRRQA